MGYRSQWWERGFLPFAQVVVKKQDRSFQNLEVSGNPKIYFAVVEYIIQFSNKIYLTSICTHGVTANQIINIEVVTYDYVQTALC